MGVGPAPLRRRALAAVSLGCLAACSPFGGDEIPPLVFARDGNVEAIAPSGRDRRQLTDVPLPGYARDPAWAPDGRSILYSYTPPPEPQSGTGGVSFTLPVADIYRLPSGDGDATLLIAHDGSTEQLETPTWSPDGRWVYFSYSALLVGSDNVITGRDFGIARVPATGGRREVVVTGAAFPTLSADGSRLAGVRQNPEDGATTLWVSAPDGSGQPDDHRGRSFRGDHRAALLAGRYADRLQRAGAAGRAAATYRHTDAEPASECFRSVGAAAGCGRRAGARHTERPVAGRQRRHRFAPPHSLGGG